MYWNCTCIGYDNVLLRNPIVRGDDASLNKTSWATRVSLATLKANVDIISSHRARGRATLIYINCKSMMKIEGCDENNSEKSTEYSASKSRKMIFMLDNEEAVALFGRRQRCHSGYRCFVVPMTSVR